ncbi:MAG: hypothetical protein ACE5LG_01300, partial [Anaerolineae bacterium]
MSKKVVFIALLAGLILAFGFAIASAQEPGDPTVCKTCHSDEYGDWSASAHPNSLEDLVATGYGKDFCLKCMSTDWRLAPEDAKPTLDTAKFGVTCLGCHPAAHETPGDDKTVITDVFATCTDCHTASLEEGAKFEAGAAVHHPQLEIMTGVGAIGVDDMASPHGSLDCNTCHVEGHLYEPADEACATCHGTAKTIVGVHGEIEPLLEALSTRLDAVPEEQQEEEAYKVAYTNYSYVSADASGGVHNEPYIEAIIDEANASLDQLPAVAAAPTATPVPTPEVVPVTG